MRDNLVSTNRTPLSRPNPVVTAGVSPAAVGGQRLPSYGRPARDLGRWPVRRGGIGGAGPSYGFYPGAGYGSTGSFYGGALSSGNFSCPSTYANLSSGFYAPGYVSYALPVIYGSAYPVPVLPMSEGFAGGAPDGGDPALADPGIEEERPRDRTETPRRPSSTLGRAVENPESVRPPLRGPDSVVEAVQEELARRGYFAGKVNGVLGASSQEALRRFQANHQLAPTGRINEATLFALGLN